MKEVLLSLPPSDLRTLASSIRSGRLSAPYSASNVARFVGGPIAASVSMSLQAMADLEMPSNAAAYSLELLAAAQSEHPVIGEMVDLVTTGPQVAGNANRDTSVVVSELFRKAEATVMVAGYAVYQGQRVFHSLAERMAERPTLKVRMFLDVQRRPGDTTASPELVRRFAHRFRTVEWPAGKPLPEIYYDPRALSPQRIDRAVLHAKCVVIDDQDVFVSSANFTEAAQERNVEVGLLLHSVAVAERLTRFFDALLNSSQFLKAL
jgi:phosphatidylserine/phosphatidylglycerophosphate/cardiolipin synthase-like enzyme